jgi:hypothetical protein
MGVVKGTLTPRSRKVAGRTSSIAKRDSNCSVDAVITAASRGTGYRSLIGRAGKRGGPCRR